MTNEDNENYRQAMVSFKQTPHLVTVSTTPYLHRVKFKVSLKRVGGYFGEVVVSHVTAKRRKNKININQ